MPGRLLVLSLPCLFALAAARAAGPAVPERGFLDRTHKGPDGQEAKYVVFVPQSYAPGKPVPTILFLHGAGEAGTDGRRQLRVGLAKAIREREASFPFLVIFPQAQKRLSLIGGTWFPGNPEGDRALAILDEVRRQYDCDPNQTYLTGVSMGGFGTWAMAAKYPDRWAAIVPVCGGGAPTDAGRIKDLPCWCFHGEKDWVVRPSLSRAMIDALKAAGAAPRYTEFAEVGHRCWDLVYGNDDLYAWLLKQTRK